MTLPKWNSEWEKPDPLRGARGWNRHRYATVGVAVLLLAAAVGLAMPVVVKARRKERELDRVYEELREAAARSPGDPPGPP